ncbi:hypothetical protein HK405_014416, partial [Cladochytrium tenue]
MNTVATSAAATAFGGPASPILLGRHVGSAAAALQSQQRRASSLPRAFGERRFDLAQALPKVPSPPLAASGSPVVAASGPSAAARSSSLLLAALDPASGARDRFAARLQRSSAWRGSALNTITGATWMRHSASQQRNASSSSAPSSSSPSSSSSDVPQLRTLADHYLPLAEIATSFSDPSTYSYPVVDATKRALVHQVMLQLSSLGERSLALACPHPGAVSFLEDTVKAAAREARADVLVLDYLTFLRASQEANTWRKTALGDDKETTLRPARRGSSFQSIKAAPSFSPANYRPHLDVEDDEEFFEEDEADEDAEYNNNQSNSNNPFIVPSTMNIKVVVPGVNGHPQVADLRSIQPVMKENGKLFFEIGNSGDDSGTAAVDAGVTHYHSQVSSQDIEIVFKSLLQQLKGPNKKSPKRAIIYLKDATEIMEASKDTGKRLIGGLIDVVKVLRHVHHQSITLIVGCTPSVLTNAVHDSPVESAAFFDFLYTGRVRSTNNPDGPAFSLAENGALFQTAVDYIPEFEKIDIPPPSAALLAKNDSFPVPAEASSSTSASSVLEER